MFNFEGFLNISTKSTIFAVREKYKMLKMIYKYTIFFSRAWSTVYNHLGAGQRFGLGQSVFFIRSIRYQDEKKTDEEKICNRLDGGVRVPKTR